jgi:hypothetical protein
MVQNKKKSSTINIQNNEPQEAEIVTNLKRQLKAHNRKLQLKSKNLNYQLITKKYNINIKKNVL